MSNLRDSQSLEPHFTCLLGVWIILIRMDLIIDASDCFSRDDLTNIIVVGPALRMLIKFPRYILSNNDRRIHVKNVKYRLKGKSGYRSGTIIHSTATHYKRCRDRAGCGHLYRGYGDR